MTDMTRPTEFDSLNATIDSHGYKDVRLVIMNYNVVGQKC